MTRVGPVPGIFSGRIACLAALVAGVLLFASSARAHEPFEITTDARVYPDRLELRISMASRTASAICRGLGKRPGDFELSDLEEFPRRFEACAFGLYAVTSGDKTLQPLGARVDLSVEHDFEAVVSYPKPGPGPLSFRAVHVERLRDGAYGATITAVGEGVFLGQALLRLEAPTLEVTLPLGTQAARSAGAAPAVASFKDFLLLGIEHILTGYDHLLFLLGLLLGCRGLRSALILVTGFTLAHSLTLALAALDVFALPSRWVEPLIAASILFVGIENAVRGERVVEGRFLLTFGFGLIHGFGFAGALRELGLGANGAPIVLPLLAFNLGVELGQAAVASALLPLLFRLYRISSFVGWGRTLLSLGVAVVGLYWLLDRILLPT